MADYNKAPNCVYFSSIRETQTRDGRNMTTFYLEENEAKRMASLIIEKLDGSPVDHTGKVLGVRLGVVFTQKPTFKSAQVFIDSKQLQTQTSTPTSTTINSGREAAEEFANKRIK